MIDVGAKLVTARMAVACGTLLAGPVAFPLIRDRALPKGDALVMAEIAGIQGAKQAQTTIPLCHPLALDQVALRFEMDETRLAVTVFCQASAHARTGVEMEALAGVGAALLALWDLAKMVEPALEIAGVRLLLKRGGKSGLWRHPAGVPEWVAALAPAPAPAVVPLEGIVAAVVTLSDRASAGVYEDRSGPVLRRRLEEAGAVVAAADVLADDEDALAEHLRALATRGDVRLIVTTGGTGVAPRDRTPEAVARVCDRLIPGLGECLRAEGARMTLHSWASRSLAGTLGRTLVIALPGSPRAVEEGLDCLLPQLRHLLETLIDFKHPPRA